MIRSSSARAMALVLSLVATTALASPISSKYAALGGQGGFLGAPTIPETTAPDGVGKFRHYQNGSIYWSPRTSAHEVHGLIRSQWAAAGWEKGYLGYPMSDEINTYDQEGQVSKFQGGELIWSKATNAVTAVKSSDLIVDLPTPVGEPWYIIQANAVTSSDSHSGPWVYCWDLDWNQNQPPTKGRTFVSSADAKVAWVEEGVSGNAPALANVVVQELGQGRYASTLHLLPGSYGKHFGKGNLFEPQFNGWDQRPVAKSGAVLAETGDIGAAAGAYHVHYCVTTSPDRPQFSPFESVPVSFRNYSVSSDGGAHWTYRAAGVPAQGQLVRREAGGGGPAAVGSSTVLGFGAVKGQIVAGVAGKAMAGGKFHVVIQSAWGEPLASTDVITSLGNLAGPWPFSFTKIPDYPGSKVEVSYSGAWSPQADYVTGESAGLAVKVGFTATQNVNLKAEKASVIK